jgi:hypothetical protein
MDWGYAPLKNSKYMSQKTQEDYKKDYTKPKLREKLKEEIKQSDQGGKSGQWSARKSQRLVKAYEAQGGGYKHPGEQTKAQKDLIQWTDEDWQTADQGAAIREGKTVRYLPKDTWNQLSKEEKEKANQLKVQGSEQGKQHISNTEEVRKILKKTHGKHQK